MHLSEAIEPKAQRVNIMYANFKKSLRLGDPGIEYGLTKTYLNICILPPCFYVKF